MEIIDNTFNKEKLFCEHDDLLLRLNIRGAFSLNEFKMLIESLKDLYNLNLVFLTGQERFACLMSGHHESFLEVFKFFSGHPTPKENGYAHIMSSPWSLFDDCIEANYIPVQLNRVIYSSPGVVDIAGFGKALQHLKDLLLKLIEIYTKKDERKLKNQEKLLNNQRLMIENKKLMVSLRKEQLELRKNQVEYDAKLISKYNDLITKDDNIVADILYEIFGDDSALSNLDNDIGKGMGQEIVLKWYRKRLLDIGSSIDLGQIESVELLKKDK